MHQRLRAKRPLLLAVLQVQVQLRRVHALQVLRPVPWVASVETLQASQTMAA